MKMYEKHSHWDKLISSSRLRFYFFCQIIDYQIWDVPLIEWDFCNLRIERKFIVWYWVVKNFPAPYALILIWKIHQGKISKILFSANEIQQILPFPKQTVHFKSQKMTEGERGSGGWQMMMMRQGVEEKIYSQHYKTLPIEN